MVEGRFLQFGRQYSILHRSSVIGMFQANLKYQQSKVTEPVYVIPNQESALLSRKACVKLGHITRTNQEIEEVISTPADSKAEFPSLFSGLERLKTEYYITFCPDGQPHCLYSLHPREIPHPLFPKVKQEIELMLYEQPGVRAWFLYLNPMGKSRSVLILHS